MCEKVIPNFKGFLICESTEAPTKPKITKKSGRGVIIEAVLQTSDVENRNHRIYTRNAIESGLKSDYVQERLRTFTWYGEFTHPMKPDVQRQMSYDPDRISHIIERVWWEGNALKGIVHSAFTRCGDDWSGLVEQGCQVAFSMRGIGPMVEKKGKLTFVNAPLHLFDYDTVIHPSHKEAYITKILSESSTEDSLAVEVSEGDGTIFEPIQSTMNNQFLNEESHNFKLISEAFEIEETVPAYLSKNRKYVIRESKEGKVAIRLEKKLSEVVDNYMNKL